MDNKENGVSVALAGNPNVGKSTVFNALTGMKQHTGNWSGKTVANAFGDFEHKGVSFTMADLPGTYSVMSETAEEKLASDFICFEKPDVTVVVTDATCLERNLDLVLQVLEMTDRTVVCVNLLDEAEKKGIHIDLDELSLQLGVPVVGTSARSGKGLDLLKDEIYKMARGQTKTYYVKTDFGDKIETEISKLKNDKLSRWLCLRLLMNEEDVKKQASIADFISPIADVDMLRDKIIATIVEKSSKIYDRCVTLDKENFNRRDRRIDKILTSKLTGIPIMIALLGIIFWITVTGANYPSELLSSFFTSLEEPIREFLYFCRLPDWLVSMLTDGMYRTLTWIIAVMLPPMAIFFPLFTILEDLGYLPRVAFNMDSLFRKANAHGKQALTTMMGFGCNACGVTGCRIINSPRERIIAILTNNFVPCNGRFPTLIAIISMFFVGATFRWYNSLLSTVILMLIILFGIFMTLVISKLLSHTILKGLPSSFALEMPPYRVPQFGKVIVRSIFDRTVFVLGRAVAIAAPAGVLIWVLANVNINGVSILSHITEFLDPFAQIMGLDGTILTAFILGFPANEIVLPLAMMGYMSSGVMQEAGNLTEMSNLLISNGWTGVTAICTMLFSLMHFPCSTTLITVYKETKSKKWTLLAFLIPTVVGVIACIIFAQGARLVGWIVNLM